MSAGDLDISKIALVASHLKNSNGKGLDKRTQKKLDAFLHAAFSRVTHVKVPPLSQFFQVIQQLAMVDWSHMFEEKQTIEQTFMRVVAGLATLDNLQSDRQHGICPVPTYDFTDADWELFLAGNDIEAATHRLKEMFIHQYFDPPSDTLALGLIEHGKQTSPDIGRAFSLATQGGHHITTPTLVPDAQSMPEVLEALKGLGYMAEGEFSYELTENGKTVRANIKMKPSESIFSKILSRFSFSVSPKDFL